MLSIFDIKRISCSWYLIIFSLPIVIRIAAGFSGLVLFAAEGFLMTNDALFISTFIRGLLAFYIQKSHTFEKFKK